jgi:hypothetical protein
MKKVRLPIRPEVPGWKHAEEANPAQVPAQRENHESTEAARVKGSAPKAEKVQPEAKLPVDQKYIVGKLGLTISQIRNIM